MNDRETSKNKSSDINSNINDIDKNVWRWKPWSNIRTDYQRIALEAYRSGDCDKSILYDSKALACGFIGTILNKDQQSHSSDSVKIDHQPKSAINWQQKTGNATVDCLIEAMKDVKIGERKNLCSTVEIDDKTQFRNLRAKLAELPKQWNIVQFSQLYNGYNGFAATKDVYTSDAPIKITLFCDSLSEKRDNQPISIVLELNEIGEKSILSTSYEVHQVLYENYISYMNSSPATYNTFMKRLKQTQSKLVTDMATWLGPWVTLISGKIKGKSGEDFERKLFEEVKKFTIDLEWIKPYQIVLLKLMARRIDLLDNEKIEQAARDIAPPNNKEYTRIKKFLMELKAKTPFKDFTYYPCILVIDEILDQMPWEMLLTSQEFTRVHSIYHLFDLHKRYKHQIDDGYLKIGMKTGFTMINPTNDDKLNDMHKRMNKFYDDSLPKWERFERITPPSEQISECLVKNDLFVFSGHGSSLQFFSQFELDNLRHNCLMLLFGCDSIAVKPSGTCLEASCPSYTYFKNGCPGTLGAITIVTDIWVDLITIWILTQWIVPKGIEHPKIEVCRDLRSKEHVGRILAKSEGKRNPNLLALLCDLRNETDISFGMRSAIIYRGLPPYNTLTTK